jgi:hypothetical protein
VSTPEAAIRLLGEIGAEDRRWILERLPVAARARLADQVDPPQETGEDYEWTRAVAQLSAADPQSLVEALQVEPAWLIDAVLHAARWPWANQVRKGLPPSLRANLATVACEGARLGRAPTRVLIRELATRSREWTEAPPPRSGLGALISRLGGRSSR